MRYAVPGSNVWHMYRECVSIRSAARVREVTERVCLLTRMSRCRRCLARQKASA